MFYLVFDEVLFIPVIYQIKEEPFDFMFTVIAVL